MEKILLDVHVPVTNQDYTLLVPKDMTIATVSELLQKYLLSLSNTAFIAQSSTYLHDSQTGRILNRNKTVEEVNLKTGNSLFFV